MAQTETDVVVLGVGTCGEDLSLQLLDAGLDVVGIEAALVGGECPYWACIPSKAMIRAASVLAAARQVDGLAGRASVEPDWGQVASRIRAEITGGWDDSGGVDRFQQRGGRLIHGRGTLVSPNSVEVNGERISARRGIVIATGSQPLIPPISGLAEVNYWTTHDVIAAEQLPKTLTVLGGGAVGCEMSQLLNEFGVAVTIIEGRRLLAAEEPESSSLLTDTFTASGITVHAGVHAERVDQTGDEIKVQLTDGTEVRSERLLVATGRTVDLGGLGLKAAGIDADGPFIEVDERQLAAPGIWAIGDVTGKAMLTHVAIRHSAIVAAEILGRDIGPMRYDAIPRVTFTSPEIAAVGMTEEQAHEAGLDVAVAIKQVPATFRGWIHGPSNAGFVKLIADREAGHLVGATAAGPQGGEVLGLLSLAVHAKTPLSDLRSMIYAFPTFHGGVGEAIGAAARGVTSVLDPDYDGHRRLDEVS